MLREASQHVQCFALSVMRTNLKSLSEDTWTKQSVTHGWRRRKQRQGDPTCCPETGQRGSGGEKSCELKVARHFVTLCTRCCFKSVF